MQQSPGFFVTVRPFDQLRDRTPRHSGRFLSWLLSLSKQSKDVPESHLVIPSGGEAGVEKSAAQLVDRGALHPHVLMLGVSADAHGIDTIARNLDEALAAA